MPGAALVLLVGVLLVGWMAVQLAALGLILAALGLWGHRRGGTG